MLDECIVLLAERALLRNEEIRRLCNRDLNLHLAEPSIDVWGKGDEERTVPATPTLSAFLRRYLEDRRPADIASDGWQGSDEPLIRGRPSARYPHGRPLGRRRIEQMLERFRSLAPELFADGRLCLHSFRHSGATWLDARYGRAMTRRALGHTSRSSPTDAYVYVSDEALREVLTAYEQHLEKYDRRADDRPAA